jgi:hypothetical protein
VPLSGLEFLKFILDHPIFASKLVLLQSVVEIHNAQRCNSDVYYFETMEKIQNFIKDTYEYFDVVDSVWWEYFFDGQSAIISRSKNEDTFLKTPFH